MLNDVKLEPSDIIYLKETSIENTYSDIINIPFKIKASDFLDFAEKDFKNGGLRGLVNSLTNVKRSMECQIDSLLFSFGLYKTASKEKWRFPKKVKILNRIGVVSPGILNKINLARVRLEHHYEKPKQSVVKDAIDVSKLFLKYTEKICKYGLLTMRLKKKNVRFRIEFNRDKEIIIVTSENKNHEIKQEITPKNLNSFINWLKAISYVNEKIIEEAYLH